MRQNGGSAVGIRCLSKGKFFEICCLRAKPLPCQAVGCLLGATLCTLLSAVLCDKAYALLGILPALRTRQALCALRALIYTFRGAVPCQATGCLLGAVPCTLLCAVLRDKAYAMLCTLLSAVLCDKACALLGILPALRTR